SSRRRHTSFSRDWSSDVCSSDLSVQDESAEEARQALEKYTIDLTARAESGKLDPVIGRDEEIRRTIQVLQRRTKNNPVLIGEPRSEERRVGKERRARRARDHGAR